MKIGIFIQARTDSKRFPNKIMADLNGKPMLQHVYERCVAAADGYKEKIFDTWVYFIIPENDPIKEWCEKMGYWFMVGSEEDVINRYDHAISTNMYNPDALIRVTGDCPAIPVSVIRTCMDMLCSYDYVSNTVLRTYPDGYDIQGCSRKAWDDIFKLQEIYREHPFREFDMNEIVRDRFEKLGFTWGQMINSNCSNQIKLSVDTPEDLERVKVFLGKNNKN